MFWTNISRFGKRGTERIQYKFSVGKGRAVFQSPLFICFPSLGKHKAKELVFFSAKSLLGQSPSISYRA